MKKRILNVVAIVLMISLFVQMTAVADVHEADAATRGEHLSDASIPAAVLFNSANPQGPAVATHVQDIAMSWGVQQGNKYFGEAVVTIADAHGHPVSEATVYGQWAWNTWPSGRASIHESLSCTWNGYHASRWRAWLKSHSGDYVKRIAFAIFLSSGERTVRHFRRGRRRRITPTPIIDVAPCHALY